MNEAFIIDLSTRNELIKQDPNAQPIIRPSLRGKDVKRWIVNFADQYFIKIESSENKKHPWSGKKEKETEEIFKQTYPSIYNYFQGFKNKLINRDDQGHYYWELRSCAYWHEFDQPKIILGRFMNKSTFAFDEERLIHNDALYMIAGVSKYIVGILNSSTTWWFLTQICTDLQNGYLQAFRENLFQIPIIENDNRTKIEQLVESILAKKRADPQSNIRELEAKIDQCVYELYKLTEEEIRLIENKQM